MMFGYLGPEGTYTEQAAHKLISDRDFSDVVLAPVEPIGALFNRLYHRELDVALVPRRNTLAGDYTETVEGLGKYPVTQIDSIELPIILALGIHPDADEHRISEIMSKDTALRECSTYLEEFFPRAKRTETASTAAAMREVRDKKLLYAAAIGSAFGLERYGLKTVRNDIGNQRENYTTFILLELRK